MILTGKAKEDFKEFLYNKYDILYKLKDYHETMLYAEIIDWFDSVGICIDRNCVNMEMVITDFRDINEEQTTIDCNHLEFPKKWFEEAIRKANEIYNSK